ncbi:MAG: hypothetical protein ACD_22C00072G0004 [uncultured bacterium]|uniref:Major facilitator superfamily (MFS) profile domain-containing protein n=1 Tax=candidate division WWE3 bacterium RBG_16_37_10 TaxID=1802610 RepID=A0A1F4V5U6_UNCKA|nr:MAG: hypothetical protein ACD_22C00072G0004 [uncultured bacterium]OGC51983.1 MAG: hypothetical protein A2W32_04740 [candidate division WWE3 bacterium RBG_16_37_10]
MNITNRALKTLFIYNGIFVFAGSLLGPLYAVYVKGLDAHILSVSLSWAAFLISTTFFTFLLSKFGDRIKHKDYLLMAGYLIRSAVWIMYAFVGNVAALILLQLLLGVGEAFGTPSFDALFAEHLDKGKHICEYSDWKVISNLVLAFGTVLGGFIVSYFGFTILFICMSLLSLAAFFGILFKPKRSL